MEKDILELKMLNAAYAAALEFDYCPGTDEIDKVVELINIGITYSQLHNALSEHEGRRPDELASEMSMIIRNL